MSECAGKWRWGYGMDPMEDSSAFSYHCVLKFEGCFAGHYVADGGDCADLDGVGDALG